jgi:protease PrsW
MYCAKCGTECQPEYKFCKSCGAPVGANGSSPSATVTAPQVAVQVAPNLQPAVPPQAPPPPPPGMVPVLYQAYPGGPQQVYYVPAQSVQPHARAGFLEGLQARVRDLASTDKLEGFSLGQTFSETFKKHGVDAVEEYMMVGSSRTTPPIDTVETGWPKPWMFFRLLMVFVIAFVVLYFVWKFTGNTPLVPAIMIMGAFAVPLATLELLFEMNTPRNVSVILVGKLFIMGGLAALCAVSFEYMVAIAGKVPGIVEETAKLAAVLLVVRGTRYKYELNGILFGAAVGAGFASFETSFYGLVNAFLPTLIQGLQQMQAPQAISAAMQAMVDNLVVRGVLAPFGHVAWTAIAAGAFWRVKRDQPTNASMLFDTRFLKAFAIPVAMHTLWDASVLFPNLSTVINICLWIGTGATTWYVLFGLIQQGLRQVKDMQRTQLQSTLAHVEAAIAPPGAVALQPQ